jgi:uncharacterized membrane protein YgdD (TMEM256/DUF423 family)
MQNFWRLSLTLTALYGAVVVGMSAAISHLFLYSLDGKALSSLLSSTAMLAFQTLALLVLTLSQLPKEPREPAKQQATVFLKLPALVAVGFHLGLWLFVYTVWAGLFDLPLHFSKLAPIGGQLLLLCWLLLAATPWIRK